MAMSVALSQPFAAIVGQPCTFIATVANSSGGNVNLNMIQPVVSLPNGQLCPGVTVGQAFPAGTVSATNTGGYQFNVVIPATGNVVFAFQVTFQGPRVAMGTAAQTTPAFVVSVNCFSSDGSAFSIQAPVTQANLPTFGPSLSTGTPLNQWPGSFPGIGATAASPAAPGTTDFQNPASAVLAL